MNAPTGIDAVDAFKLALFTDHVRDAEHLLATSASVRRLLDAPLLENGLPPLGAAPSVAMADLLLRHGADLAVLSRWWAPGLWVVESIEAHVGRHLAERGAALTVHAAAALGLSDRLGEMLDKDKALVNAVNADGCRPLHFARTPSVADLLVRRGADVNARDDVYGSPPLHWRIADGSHVAARLLSHGADPDIFTAVALNDVTLVRKLVAADPGCVVHRIGDARGPFPGPGFNGTAGTILQWTLGFHISPHEVALRFGHGTLFDLLWAVSPLKTRFLVACTAGDRSRADAVKAAHPHIVAALDDKDLALLSTRCSDTGYDIKAVRLMLDLGFPPVGGRGVRGFTPLHHAAFHGYADLTALLLRHGHPPDPVDPDEGATPLQWAVYGAVKVKKHPEGNYRRVLRLLLEFGAAVPDGLNPTGDDALDEILADACRR